ncbi:hypothetical protein ACIGQE_19250 [Streptomyces sp. NPDC053429]|uniref:hypothetical protein n=1 Tax=Streptomyces sp. NPDC053429 TaxID=3365702 RepID=UPI0037CF5476
MNDRNIRAAAQYDDPDGDPGTAWDRADAAEERAGESGHPGAPPAAAPADVSPETVRTLLDTAATCRPVEEVTALVGLLKETGLLSRSGQEALAAAAVSRSVEDVRHMVALLGEPPDGEVEAGIALRAAALGRSVEDVAILARTLGGGCDQPADPAAPSPHAPPAVAPAPGAPTAHAEKPGTAETAEKAEKGEDGGGDGDGENGGAGGGGGPGAVIPEDLGTQPRPDPAPYSEQPPQPPPPPGREPARPRPGVLRHVLRWPAAAALLLCGAVHLPGNPAALPAVGPVGHLPTVVAVLCLGLGVLLAVRDTPVVWRAAAVAALGVVALHLAGGIAVFDPLAGALGGSHAWAGAATVLCAGAGSVLAGLALMYGPRPGPAAPAVPVTAGAEEAEGA